jgi:branched-chain amino acid transport system ATP-binding protein
MISRIRDQGTTVIIVEQSVNLALTIAETAYFMEKGEIRFHGRTAELLARPDILRSVFLEGLGGRAGPLPAVPEPDGADATAGEELVLMDRLAPGDPATVADGARAATVQARDVTPAAVEVIDVRVRFGGIEAIGGVSLRVAPGEIVGIIGPNGAGKTTLLDVISGFTRADAGRVLLGGHDITGIGPDRRARLGLGRSFQDASLFPALTVEETIAVAMERWVSVKDPVNPALHLPAAFDSEQAVRKRVSELIEMLGLESVRTKFVHELSTGVRRVVDLACVIAHRPSVVLLDEPSSGIAQRESEALAPLLLRLRDELDASLILIEHDMPLISAVADRLVALDRGLIISAGPSTAVLQDPVVISSYLGDNTAAVGRSGAFQT